MAVWPFGKKSKQGRASRRTNAEGTQRDLSVKSLSRSQPYIVEDDRPSSGRSNRGPRGIRREQTGLAKELECALPDRDEKHAGSVPATTDTTSSAQATATYSAAQGFSRKQAEDPEKDRLLEPNTATRDDIPSYYFLNPTSTTSLASDRRGSWQRPPTLRAKRSANDAGVLRRISSKKKKQDPARERDIKTMSIPSANPRRPVTHSGGPLSRESMKAHSKSDWHLVQRNRSSPQVRRPERPRSEVYAADPETMPSIFPGMFDRPAYKVNAFDVLSPRPTIRCWDAARPLGGAPALPPSRSNSKREKQPPAISEEEAMDDKRRVDELADHLDSGGIRELMERDQRRRERKQKADEVKAQRKLQRRAERQRAEEEARVAGVPAEVEAMEPGVFEPEPDGLGKGEPSTGFDPGGATRDSRKENANPSPLSWLRDPSVERLHRDAPRSSSARNSVSHVEGLPIDDHEEPVIGTAKAVRLSQASMSPPSSPKQVVRPTSNISQITDSFRENTASTTEPTELDQRGSISSSRGQSGTWISFFRRSGMKTKRDSVDHGRRTPSEFSNTSRDSLTRQPPPASVRSSFQRKSGTPVRTTSKFREELPESPLSPPDSRLQSPDPVSIMGVVRSAQTDSLTADAFPLAATYTTAEERPAASSRKSKEEGLVARHQSLDRPSIEGKPPSTAVSQSMASIDSEGSWLSGKPAKRASQTQTQIFNLRRSASSLHRRFQDFSDSGEELGVAEDEYFSQLTPGLGMGERTSQMKKKASSTAIASSESDGEGDGQPGGKAKEERTWHGGVARHPTVIHHTTRAKSREGLLNDYHELDGPGDLGDSPASDVRSFEDAVEERSKGPNPTVANVDQGMKQHLRHISAGSAKLLEIGPRSSTENRFSTGSGKSIAKS